MDVNSRSADMHAAALPDNTAPFSALVTAPGSFFGGWLSCRGATFPFPVALLIEMKPENKQVSAESVFVLVYHCNPTKLFSFRLHADRRGLAERKKGKQEVLVEYQKSQSADEAAQTPSRQLVT